jgi:hypothetical protein
MRQSLTHRFEQKGGGAFIMKHESEGVKVVIDVIAEMQIDLIIELGTFRGGFTKLLNDAFPIAELHTYDLYNETKQVREFFNGNVVFHNEDVLIKCPSLMQLLNRKEKKLLYCDNGRKRQEVAMYSWQLNPGDFLGVHDWGYEIFLKDVNDYVSEWEQFGWGKLVKAKTTSRFWRKP